LANVAGVWFVETLGGLSQQPLDLVGCSVVLTKDRLAAKQFAAKNTKPANGKAGNGKGMRIGKEPLDAVI
jgi:hypothetical protein